jgi:hypothetical protein
MHNNGLATMIDVAEDGDGWQAEAADKHRQRGNRQVIRCGNR